MHIRPARNTPPINFDWDTVLVQLGLLETMPDWAVKVLRARPEGEWYVLADGNGYPVEADPNISQEFYLMGILARQPRYLFI